jgi:methyl-accepting chemotaxis protein
MQASASPRNRRLSGLGRVVRISEEIKQVVSASREINIVAINALLTARQAGERSRGFAVVARETRQLAARLDAAMGQLDGHITRLVDVMARQMRERRQRNYVERALTTVPEQAGLQRACEALRRRDAGLDRNVETEWFQLERDARHALMLAEMGSVLARSAKIEAVHGQAMAPVLKHVAEQIEATIEVIVSQLKGALALTKDRTE